MFDDLQQFNKLPKELKDRVSSPAAMEILSSLEKKYGVSLAMLVIKVMIKQVLIKDLESYLITEMNLNSDQAKNLSQELQERLFFSVANYLGLKKLPSLNTEEKELQVLIKENNIIFPSQDLMNRCLQILLTYRKGIRTKIDVRSALERPVDQGGLGLETTLVDKLFRALEKGQETSSSLTTISKPKTVLTEMINKNELNDSYDLKSALIQGVVKPPAKLASKFKPVLNNFDLQHELEAPEKRLVLEKGKEKEVNQENLTSVNKEPVFSAPITKTPQIENKEDKVIKEENLKSEIKSNSDLSNLTKTEKIQTPSLQPEKNLNTNIIKPKSNFWSKVFKVKEKKNETPFKKIDVSSNNLAEIIKQTKQTTPIIARPAASLETKTKIEDVRVRPKIMGPIEELRYLDLINFRRLGNSPKEITDKIVRKIKLLEKDGYDRMIEAVKAWRQSPVNRLYLFLAQEAVNKGVTLKDVVINRQSNNKETLTMEEIEAIVSMNNRLMF